MILAMETTMHKLILLVILLVSPSVFAQDFLPKEPTGYVNDYANILSRNERAQLERKLSAYRDTTTNVIVVATLKSLRGYEIEEVATNLFNSWDIQYETRNNGVLLLISEQDRRIRIEVGYGLEGAIPDILAGRIIDEIITPQFRSGNFYGGINNATSTLMQLAAGEYEGDLTNERRKDDEDDPIGFVITIFIILFLLTRRGRRRSYGPGGFIYWGGGLGSGSGFGGGGSGFGGGGGFGGFGGGGGFSSGGGGASGGW